jgi:hypothetical protein
MDKRVPHQPDGFFPILFPHQPLPHKKSGGRHICRPAKNQTVQVGAAEIYLPHVDIWLQGMFFAYGREADVAVVPVESDNGQQGDGRLNFRCASMQEVFLRGNLVLPTPAFTCGTFLQS